MKLARIVGGRAVDTRDEGPEGFFHPAIAAEFEAVPDEVQDGWVLTGSTWSAPQVPTPPPAPPARLPVIAPAMFYMAFKPAEAIAIKASTDPLVGEFFARLQLAISTDTPIDPNLVSVTEGIQYLVSINIVAAGRVNDILAGVSQ